VGAHAWAGDRGQVLPIRMLTVLCSGNGFALVLGGILAFLPIAEPHTLIAVAA